MGEERTGKKRQGKPEKTSNDSKKLLLTIFDFLVRRNRSWKRPTRRRYASCIYRRAIHLYSSLPTLRQLSVFFLSTTTPSQLFFLSLSLSLSIFLILLFSCPRSLHPRLPTPRARDFSNYPFFLRSCLFNPVAVLTRSWRRQSRQSASFNSVLTRRNDLNSSSLNFFVISSPNFYVINIRKGKWRREKG